MSYTITIRDKRDPSEFLPNALSGGLSNSRHFELQVTNSSQVSPQYNFLSEEFSSDGSLYRSVLWKDPQITRGSINLDFVKQ